MFDLARLDAFRLRYDADPRRFGVPYAEALRRAGQLEAAIAVMRTTLAMEERNVLGLGILARCLRDLGHPEEAGIAVRSALALDPDDPVASELAYLVPFAPAQSEEGSSDTLMAAEETPLRQFEGAPVMRLEEAPATAREDEATMEWEKPSFEEEAPLPPASMPSVFVTQTMAELYVQQGLPEHAVAIYRELTMRSPDDARLAARLAEVVALAGSQDGIAPPAVVEHVGEVAHDGGHGAPSVNVLDALPLLDDFAPMPSVESSRDADADAGAGADEAGVVQRFAQDASEPESFVEASVIPSAFDFSEDAYRAAPTVSTSDESMLASLSFEAISLPTPAPDGAGLDLPVGAGPSAREALRQLATRPVATRVPRRATVVPPPRLTARSTGSGAAPTSRVGTPPPADPTGDDFDQWLRGVS